MNLVQKDGVFRFATFRKPMLPLVEGKCPPEQDEDGNWYYPEPVEYNDPEIMETDSYSVDDKEEFYDYQTTCKNCGTRFIARDPNEELVRNFCPGCGKKLDSGAIVDYKWTAEQKKVVDGLQFELDYARQNHEASARVICGMLKAGIKLIEDQQERIAIMTEGDPG